MTHFRFHRLDCFSFSFFPAVMYFRASNLSFYYCLLLSFIFCITVVFCCLSSFVFRDFFVCSHVLSSINSFVSLLSFVVFHLFFGHLFNVSTRRPSPFLPFRAALVNHDVTFECESKSSAIWIKTDKDSSKTVFLSKDGAAFSNKVSFSKSMETVYK